MARDYQKQDYGEIQDSQRSSSLLLSIILLAVTIIFAATPLATNINPSLLFIIGIIVPGLAFANTINLYAKHYRIEHERKVESAKRGGKAVLGMPPQRTCFAEEVEKTRVKGKNMIDKYLVGFEVDTGAPLWVDDEDMCSHGCVFAKTGVGKTLWLESLIFQQMARGRASGLTFIDAKRDSGVLAHIILMALITGRIEDLVVIDPFDSIHAYNFVLTNQRTDVKARKVLRAGLPPTSDQSATKHYDRLAADSVYRMVRAMESFGLSWSIHDIAVALSAFNLAYPQLRRLLAKIGAKQAMVELGHLASSYRSPGKGGALDTQRITDNLRGIASELHSISGSEMGKIFCTSYTDLALTDAILRGKIIYFMLPRLEEAESAARMVKVFREDLEVSIGEITSSRVHHLEDPHLVIIDEGSSTFGPTWANLFELARKGRFALLFGAQSTGGLTDTSLGLSESFYERVMANVNLKVMMRVGDNRTAQEMTEWIGKVTTTKKTVGAGVTTGVTSQLLSSGLDARRSGGESQTINISEDETDLVSAEELKHEMSAEKGLAWFDLGTGKIVKGRSFWFNAEIPQTWEGREHITYFEKYENDEVGLADWVDEQIYTMEHQEMTKLQPKPKKPDNREKEKEAVKQAIAKQEEKAKEEGRSIGAPTSFKINPMTSMRKVRGTVSSFNLSNKPEVNNNSGNSNNKKKR